MSISLDQSKNYLVTGGAGFIGSHLVERLLSMGCRVTIYDNLSDGTKWWLKHPHVSPSPRFVEADLRDAETLNNVLPGHDIVFHLAAFTDTRRSGLNHDTDLQNGTLATWHLLEAMQKHSIRELVFASTQQVYGELKTFPISESAGPLLPISLYGASKLACEGIISAYSHLFGIRVTICRFSNIVGGRMRHGIVRDFIYKLLATPERLQILGDGQQARNYLLVEHCLDAVLLAFTTTQKENCTVYNVGNLDTITAREVGQIVIEEMHLDSIANISCAGGDRGWQGDVPNMQYDLRRIQGLGWQPSLNSKNSVRECVRRILRDVASES